MFTLTVHGARAASQLLHGIAGRARDPSPAWNAVADDVFAFERRWWLTGGGGTWGRMTDKEQRPGRNPRYMFESGGLMASATVRGANRQIVKTGPDYLFIAVTHGLAAIHERHGRGVLGVPGRREINDYRARVGSYILTGRL